MQRNNNSTIQTLLSLESVERQRYISTFNINEVNQAIETVRQMLAASEKELHISLQPATASNYSGERWTSYTTYNGTGRKHLTKEKEQLPSLLAELKHWRSQLNKKWQDQVSILLFGLTDSLRNKSNESPKEELKASGDIENLSEVKDVNGSDLIQARDDFTMEILNSHSKIMDEMRAALDQTQMLKVTLADKDKLIMEQKNIIDALIREEKDVKLNNDQEIKRIEAEKTQLMNQLYDLKMSNSQLQKKLENNDQAISEEMLRSIVRKYENKKYHLFSRAPEMLNYLQRLYGQSAITRLDIQACLNDPDHLFDHPISKRANLTNREWLICDLADAFNQHSAPELKIC